MFKRSRAFSAVSLENLVEPVALLLDNLPIISMEISQVVYTVYL